MVLQVREIIENHAFKESHEFIVALSGSFDVILNNGEKEQKFSLNKPYSGLLCSKLDMETHRKFFKQFISASSFIKRI